MSGGHALGQGSHARYNGVTMVLQWCYNGVTMVLQWCYDAVPVRGGRRNLEG
jgi:hypothetical protein